MNIIAAVIIALIVIDECERHHGMKPAPRHYIHHPANLRED